MSFTHIGVHPLEDDELPEDELDVDPLLDDELPPEEELDVDPLLDELLTVLQSPALPWKAIISKHPGSSPPLHEGVPVVQV